MTALFVAAGLTVSAVAGLDRSVSLDEGMVLFRNELPLDQFLRALAVGPAGSLSLYYFFTSAIAELFGNQIIALRVFSLLGFGLSIALFFELLNGSKAPRLLILAGLSMYVFSPLVIYYGADARWYPWVLFFTVALVWAVQANRWNLLAVIPVAAIGLFAPLATLVLPVAIAAWIERPGRRRIFGASIFAQIILLAIFIYQATDRYWNIPTGRWYPSSLDWILEAISFLWSSPVLVGAALFAIVQVAAVRTLFRSGRPTMQCIGLFGALLPIPAAMVAASLFDHNLAVRYLIFMIPVGIYLLVAWLPGDGVWSAIYRVVLPVAMIVATVVSFSRSSYALFATTVDGSSGTDVSLLFAECTETSGADTHVWDPLLLFGSRFYEYLGQTTWTATCPNWTNGAYDLTNLKLELTDDLVLTARPLLTVSQAVANNAGKERIRVKFLQPLMSDRFMATMDLSRFWVPDDWRSGVVEQRLARHLRSLGFAVELGRNRTITAEIEIPNDEAALRAVWGEFTIPFLVENVYGAGAFLVWRVNERIMGGGIDTDYIRGIEARFPGVLPPLDREFLQMMKDRE